MALGSASRAIHGHAAPETLRTIRAPVIFWMRLCAVKEQMAVLYGAFSVPFVRGEYAFARPVAEQALAVAAKGEDPEATAFANRMMVLHRVGHRGVRVIRFAPRSCGRTLRAGDRKHHGPPVLAGSRGVVTVPARAFAVAARRDRSGHRSVGKGVGASGGD